MGYALSIVIDEKGQRKVDVLQSQDLRSLDEYTTTHFLDKADARAKISDANPMYASMLRNFSARIVVTTPKSNGGCFFFQAFYNDRKDKLDVPLVIENIECRFIQYGDLVAEVCHSFERELAANPFFMSPNLKKLLQSEHGSKEYQSVVSSLSEWVEKSSLDPINGYSFLRIMDRFTEKWVNDLENAKPMKMEGENYPRMPRRRTERQNRIRINPTFPKMAPFVMAEDQLQFESIRRGEDDLDSVWALYDLDEVMRYEGVMASEEEILSSIVPKTPYLDAVRSQAPKRKSAL